MKKRSRITRRRLAGPDHAVLTVVYDDKRHAFRRDPCEQCPWRKDMVGTFPAEAFRHSAATAYDAAMSIFGCHMSKTTRPLTCAGFLLSEGALHNILVRIACAFKGLDLDQVKSDVPLFQNYRSMAIANGVAADDPALAQCRDRNSRVTRRRR